MSNANTESSGSSGLSRFVPTVGAWFGPILLAYCVCFPAVADPVRADMPEPWVDAHNEMSTPILDDESLLRVRGRGAQAVELKATETTNVILWDESGHNTKGANPSHAQSAGTGNVQQSSTIIRRH